MSVNMDSLRRYHSVTASWFTNWLKIKVFPVLSSWWKWSTLTQICKWILPLGANPQIPLISLKLTDCCQECCCYKCRCDRSHRLHRCPSCPGLLTERPRWTKDWWHPYIILTLVIQLNWNSFKASRCICAILALLWRLLKRESAVLQKVNLVAYHQPFRSLIK